MFKYYFIKQLKNKSFIFWAVMFPICLMICFKLAFGNLYDEENSFDPAAAVYVNNGPDVVDVTRAMFEAFGLEGFMERFGFDELMEACVNGDYEYVNNFDLDEDEVREYLEGIGIEEDSIVITDEMIEMLEEVSYSLSFELALNVLAEDGDNKCLDLTKADSIEEARAMLDSSDKHVLFIIEGDEIRVELSKDYSDVDLIIVNSIISTFDAEYDVIRESINYYMENEDALEDLEFGNSFNDSFVFDTYIKAKADVFGQEPNPYNWYYYATFVMGIMFSIITGVGIVADIEANVTKSALRVSVSPTKKSVLLLNAFFARMVLIFLCQMIQLIIMRYVFEIPVGHRFWQLMLFIVIADIFVLSLGVILGLFIKGSLANKESIANSFLMTSVFLGGEMVHVLPGFLEKKCPIINAVNPATVMNFAFYRLVFYENLNGFYLNVLKIFVASIVLIAISISKLRRQRYASL